MLEKRLRRPHGRDVRGDAPHREEMAAVVEANPFADEPGNRVAGLLPRRARRRPTLLDAARTSTMNAWRSAPREIYVALRRAGMGHSKLRIPAAAAGTARNMNTVTKLAELAREMS